MKNWLIALVLGCWSVSAIGNEPLKKPLVFVPSDSIVVWGDDRSDYRNAALAVDPRLEAKPMGVTVLDEDRLMKEQKVWKKNVLPHLHLLGGLIDENGQFQIVPTRSMVESAGRLFLQTARAHYIDVVERAALNGLMAIATPGPLSFSKHIAAQALMNISGMVYATDEEGVYVNLYVNNSAHICQDGWNLYIDQLTAMPHSGRVKIRISGLDKGLKPIKLRLRVPDWAFVQEASPCHFALSGTPVRLPKIYVNGHEDMYPVENGYWIIERRWNSGDEVYFDFPLQPQLLHPSNQGKVVENVAALQCGPLVYGFPTATDALAYDRKDEIQEDPNPNKYGHSVYSVPVRSAAGDSVALKAEPVMDGASYLWMNVK